MSYSFLMTSHANTSKPTAAVRKSSRRAPLPRHLTSEQIAFLEENGIPLRSGFARGWGLFAGKVRFAAGEDANAPVGDDWDADSTS